MVPGISKVKQSTTETIRNRPTKNAFFEKMTDSASGSARPAEAPQGSAASALTWTSTCGCGVRPQDHQNSSSIIPRNAQQVQGPCGVDPGPPGGSQAGSGGGIEKSSNTVLLKRDKPI